MKKRLYMIVGRVGTGKRCLMEKVLKANPSFRPVIFYTTNPDMGGEYITPEESVKVPVKLLRRVEEGHEYFTTPERLAEGDICIASPTGLKELCVRFPETAFILVHLTADENMARAHVVNAADDAELAERWFRKKSAEEKWEFSAFEAEFKSSGGVSGVVTPCYDIQNDYCSTSLEGYPENIGVLDRKANNMLAIVQMLKAAGFVNMQGGHALIFKKENAEKGRQVSDIQLAYEMLADPEGAGSVVLDSLLEIAGLDMRAAAPTNTKVSYRCGGTAYQAFIVEGTLSPAMEYELTSCFEKTGGFIPSQAGLPELRVDDAAESEWFDSLAFELTKEPPTVDMTAYELYRGVKEAKGV